MKRAGIAFVPSSLAAALALVVAPTASSHILDAHFAYCNSEELCFDTHVDGHYTNGGVPGVDANYSFYDTSVDSDNGHSSIDAGWSWLEGTTPPGSFDVADVIEENVDLFRIAPGPILVRVTLLLDAAAQITGTGIVQLNALVSFPGCQVYSTQYLFNGVMQDPEIVGGDCAAESTGSALVMTATYDDQPPTHPTLRTQLDTSFIVNKKGTIAAQLASNLHFEVWNATTTWDTPTFLTQAPEPEGDALALVALGAIAASARRRALR